MKNPVVLPALIAAALAGAGLSEASAPAALPPPPVERVALASGESWLAGADGGASLDTLACVLTALGETDEAKERFAAAFESADSRTAPAWDSLMRARRAVGRKTRQVHLAQCWERAGETAPAKVILDALRAEGFVPPPPEDAAYDALAEKLGAAPLPLGNSGGEISRRLGGRGRGSR